MKKLILFSSFFALLSCSSQLYIPTQAVTDVSLEDLTKGRAVYANNCGSCHELYLPKKYEAKKWDLVLDDMQKRAEVTNADRKLIYQYLIHAPKDL